MDKIEIKDKKSFIATIEEACTELYENTGFAVKDVQIDWFTTCEAMKPSSSKSCVTGVTVETMK